MADSNFRDEEIRQHLRETSSRRKNLDYDRAKLMSELKILASRGDEAEFETKLLAAGIESGSEQWNKAKNAFRAFRQPR
jgi:hypothetical protein